MSDGVLVERRGSVLVITLDRPAKRNAMNGAMARGLAAAVDELDADPDLVVGVLTGSGGTFCAGMDLQAFLTGDVPEVPGRGLGGITRTQPLTPLIAAVEGYALAGGCELVLACDLVVAADNATFGLPEVTRGLVAGAGGLVRLPRRIPAGIALEHALTGAADELWDRQQRLLEQVMASADAQEGAVSSPASPCPAARRLPMPLVGGSVAASVSSAMLPA